MTVPRSIKFFPPAGSRNSPMDYIGSIPTSEKVKMLNRLVLLSERLPVDWPRGWCKKFEGDVTEFKKCGGRDHRVMFLLDGETLLVVVHAFRKEAQEIREQDRNRTMINRNAYWESKKEKSNGQPTATKS